MPLTPCFEAEQTDAFVILTIRVPYVKISEAEIDINQKDFKFHCHPYILCLQFTGEIVEDGTEKAQYDVSTGNIVVHIPKKTPGEHFSNLGMLTTLLKPRSIGKVQMLCAGQTPCIEVVSSEPAKVENDVMISDRSDNDGTDSETECFETEEKRFDWESGASVVYDKLGESSPDCHGYGFASKQHGVFIKLQNEIPSIIDCPDPDGMTLEERRLARLAHEQTSFDPNHYLADLMEGEEIERLVHIQPPWMDQFNAWKKQKEAANSIAVLDSNIIKFTDKEKEDLKNLPNKEYLLDADIERKLYLGLVDIVFAYCYNYRTTEGEHTVESAWTCCKLSSTLCWLEVYDGNLAEVVYCSMRRCLCYPLYRHWRLARAVLEDTKMIFQLGRCKVLQCLLDIHQLLNSSEPYYILNNLYITDYCVWIQHASPHTLHSLAEELGKVNVDKSDLDFDLPELEEAAVMVLKDEEEKETDTGTDSNAQDSEESSSEEEIEKDEEKDKTEKVNELEDGSMEGGDNGGICIKEQAKKLEKLKLK